MTARDPSASPAQRICPSCGHANSGISLFCAECGAVLNGASMDEGRSGAFDPSLTMSAASDPGQTQPIRSAAPEQDWTGAPMGASADPGATAPLPKMTPPVSSVTPPAPSSPAASDTPAWMAPSGDGAAQPSATLATAGVSFGMAEEHHQSMRGFWFGVVAFILILAVLGLYGWSILPDGGFRDTVQGWF